MVITQLDVRQTLIVAILVLYLGKYLTQRITVLREFNIPDAVSGGVLASLLFGLIYAVGQHQITFNLALRDALLIMFFTTVGLSAKLSTLLKGGRPLLILLSAASLFLIVQNLTGITLAALLGLDLPLGLIAGSVSLSGGHGTTIAWGPIFQNTYGIENAMEIGIACATFGLILGGVIGGPIAKRLITRHQLRSTGQEPLTISVSSQKPPPPIDYNTLLHCLLVIGVTIGLGMQINDLVSATGLKLPDFVACLFAGIVLTNTVPLIYKRFPWPANTPSLALISDLSLGLFLAMSLMSLQLWTLADMGVKILFLLAIQVMVSVLYIFWVIFPVMGRNFDAAVMAAGYGGLTLGATPTAIANMTAVTTQFGPSPQAFIVLPLVGAFFIDLVNALVIQKFLALIGTA